MYDQYLACCNNYVQLQFRGLQFRHDRHLYTLQELVLHAQCARLQNAVIELLETVEQLDNPNSGKATRLLHLMHSLCNPCEAPRRPVLMLFYKEPPPPPPHTSPAPSPSPNS